MKDILIILWKETKEVLCALEGNLFAGRENQVLDWYSQEYDIERDKITYIFCWRLHRIEVPSNFEQLINKDNKV